ncbi:hypothetical protein CWB99_21640 [Pseudoalteromonas rubra]|uniref:Uncharacterized protein n=1 Tax=Pseudoalteromonas rubra TaxID=43658 RepID=A0A5S3WGV2_9GAMM|nr:hypothetical protein [Pseudoalteromonas rubra]TMP24618.1 hypothetical protein CWB99_21640 [Pseudoalteromonas rubra]TMP36309.1 hypothetical protein CWC00_02385 [Pseudoalteromonas rubra]
MKPRMFIILMFVAIGLGYWWLSGDAEPAQVQTDTNKNTPAKAPLVKKAKAAAEVAPQTTPEQKRDRHIPVQMTEAAEHIAQHYEQQLQFAPYSQPLTAADADRLSPNHFYPVTIPTQNIDEVLTLKLSQYRFVYPEPIELVLTGSDIYSATVTVSEVDSNKVLTTQSLIEQEGSYTSRIKGKKTFPRELQLTVRAHVRGDEIPLVAQIHYMKPSAELLNLEQPQVQGSDLLVYARLKVQEAGIYRIRANLFSGDQPLSHVVARKRLSEGTQLLPLKIHQSVLPQQASALKLTTFVVERMSGSPQEKARYGRSNVDTYMLDGVDLSELSRVPYTPTEQERQKLAFLKQLGNQ